MAVKNHNFRFNMEKDNEVRAWEILHSKEVKHELEKDKEILDLLVCMIADITPAHDSKLQELFDVIDDKQEHPINVGNKKIIIFTAFADTADYLFETVGV